MAEELRGGGLALVAGGTDNHLILIDFNGSEMTGMRAEDLLRDVGITANKNAVPGDRRPPTVTSGLRVGTPAMTTRGFGLDEAREVGRIIAEVLTHEATEERIARLRARARALTESYPLYNYILPGMGGAGDRLSGAR